MKRFILVASLLLTVGGITVSLLWYFFKERADVSATVSQVSEKFGKEDGGSSNGGSGSGPAGRPEDLLGQDDAAFLRYARDSRLGLKTPKTWFVEDVLTQSLFAEAERRKLVPEGLGEGSVWTVPRSTLGRSELPDGMEQSHFIRVLDGAIHEIGERVVISLADQAILKQLEAEAELQVLQQDLKQLKLAEGKVPAEPLMLLPPEQLDRAINSLRPHERALNERLALYDTSDAKMALEHIRSRIQKFTSIRSKPGYAEFHQNGEGFKGLSWAITKEQWDTVHANADTKVKAVLTQLREKEAAIPGKEEIARFIHHQRGPPPDSPAARVFDAVRYFDLDVATAVRSQARLEAALSDLRVQLPLDHPLLRCKGYQQILAIMSDPEFHQFSRLLRLIQHDMEIDQLGALERKSYIAQWALAAEAEKVRRSNQNEASYENDPLVTQLIDFQLKGRDTSLTAKAKAKHLAVSQMRFPDNRTMPVGLKEEVERSIASAIDEYKSRLEQARKSYEVIAERVAKVTTSLDTSIVTKLNELRTSLRQAVREFRDYVYTAEERQYKIDPSIHEHISILSVWFFGPDAPPPPMPPEDPSKPLPGPRTNPSGSDLVMKIQHSQTVKSEAIPPLSDPYNASSRSILLMTDPAIHKSLGIAGEHETFLQKALKTEEITVDPPKFGIEKDRYTLSRSELKADIKWSSVGQREKNKSRLPETVAHWEGRLKVDETDKTKKTPFDYNNEVWKFKSFQPVGGGIHFGSTGRYEGQSTSKFVLRYDLKLKQLILTGPSTSRGINPPVYRLMEVRPEVLKPLFQFVNSGRNAAISIGWGMEKSSSLFDRSLEQSVLLDPYLVDTPVGQDLVLADTVTWSFHTKKIGSDAFYKAFGTAREQSDIETGSLLDGVLNDLKPYDRASVNDWTRKHAHEFVDNVFGDISRAILESTNVEQAREQLIGRYAVKQVRGTIDRGLEQASLPQSTNGTIDELRNGVKRLTLSNREFKSIPRRADETPEDYSERVIQYFITSAKVTTKERFQQLVDSKEEIDQEVDDRDKLALRFLKARLQVLFSKDNVDYDLAIRRELFQQFELAIQSSKGCHKELLQHWLASCIASEKGVDKDKVLKDIVTALIHSQVSLAVLMDEPEKTKIEISSGRLSVSASMQLRYARTRIEVKDGRVYFGKVPHDSTEVVYLTVLNDLVNKHYSEIETAYTPFQSVKHYAELAAFLRWAIQAKQNGVIGGIDLSELAEVPPRDRKKYPTPDILTR